MTFVYSSKDLYHAEEVSYGGGGVTQIRSLKFGFGRDVLLGIQIGPIQNGLLHLKVIHPLWKILEKCTTWGV